MTNLIALASILAVGVFLLRTGCEQTAMTQHPNSGLPLVRMKVGDRTFTLEVAKDDVSRTRGLMRRDSMPADHGMIFVFPDSEPRSFWMKNTRIPLDILYLDETGRIVSIHTMKPYDTTGVPSAGPAKYAIELNAGVAQEIGAQPGQLLDVPADARDTKE